MICKVRAEKYETAHSDNIIGYIEVGQEVVPAGPTVVVDGDEMLPIQPSGAVYLGFFEDQKAPPPSPLCPPAAPQVSTCSKPTCRPAELAQSAAPMSCRREVTRFLHDDDAPYAFIH